MPRRPSNSSFSLTISENFDETKTYRVKLEELEERESTFPGAKPGSVGLVWKMVIYDENGEAFEDTSTGEVFILWAWSSDSTFANPTTGQRAKGRAYTEAFMGRELEDDEVNQMIDEGFSEILVGKMALGSFEITTNADGNQRLSVVKLRPIKEPRAIAAAPVAAAAPAPRKQQRRLGE